MDATPGLPAINTGALDMISAGIRPGDTGPRYGLNAAAAAAAAAALALVARLGVTENIGCKDKHKEIKLQCFICVFVYLFLQQRNI